MDFLSTALKNLPAVAASGTAFVGYVLVLLSWLIISLRVRRNRQLLQNLEKLPEHQRLEALRLEMGVVSVKGGLSPEEWIRTRIYQYIFIGFCLILLLVVVLFAISALRPPTAPAAADVTVYQPGQRLEPTVPSDSGEAQAVQTVAVDNSYDGSGVQYYGAGYDSTVLEPEQPLKVEYDYQRTAAGIEIRPTMEYFDLVKRGGPTRNVDGILIWQFPRLSVKILNNTGLAVLVTEVAVRVDSSVVDIEPLLRTEYTATGTVPLINDGWGAVVDPRIQFDLREAAACDSSADWADSTLPYRTALATFRESSRLQFDGYLTKSMTRKVVDSESGDLCVQGVITYTTERGDQRTLKFQSLQNLMGVGGGEAAKIFYDLFLRAGQQGYTKLLPVSHSLKPGEAEQFVVRIGSDKSARFDLGFTLRGAGGVSIPADHIRLSIFVPRTATRGTSSKLLHTGAKWSLEQ